MLTILRVFLFKAFRTTGAVAIYTGKKRNSNKDQIKNQKNLKENSDFIKKITLHSYGFLKKELDHREEVLRS